MIDALKAAGLLTLSNLFMTAAWYGHLRFTKAPLARAVLASWGLAFVEYTLQVPANRIGYRVLSAYQLKGDPGGHHADDLRAVRRALARRGAPGEVPGLLRTRPRRGARGVQLRSRRITRC